MTVYRADAGGSDSDDVPLTIEEYERLPEESLYRLELVDGRIVREPRPGAEHGWLALEIGGRLREHVLARDLGVVLVDVGVILATDPPTIRGPDVAFVAAENVPEDGLPRGFLQQAPTLAVEVASPSNRRSELEEKAMAYLDAGTREVWLVDPGRRLAVVLRSAAERRTLRETDALDGGDIVPGFRLPLTELFER